LQAFKQCPDKVIDGTLKVESDAELLVTNFRRDSPMTYVVTAEVGDLGLEFTGPYTNLDVEVDAVLNQAKEDEAVEQAVTRSVFSA
jgi:hypothetical protein